MVLEAVLKRDRYVIVGAIIAVVALAWLYLADMAIDMSRMDAMTMAPPAAGEMADMAEGTPAAEGTDMAGDMAGMEMAGMAGMPMTSAWTVTDAVLVFVMWSIMMIGMMLPSAAPMILIFARINSGKREGGHAYAPTAVFAAGYLLVWVAFSLLAAAAQWGLQSAGLLSPMMASASGYLGGALFVAAGLYQLTPLKHACLKNCRSPLSFLMHHWRNGTGGALRMGFEHGAYCTGCCWLLMALLFVLGVMNLAWVAGLAILVLIEKVVPRGDWLARAGGVGMIGFGLYLLITG